MSADLHEQQRAFAAHLRDPDAHPAPPGVEARRMALYRRLFLNNIIGLLSGNFPVIRTVLGEPGWNALVAAFYARHRSRTPLFPELPREFIRYLEERDAAAGDPPWLAELAHYEWIELAVQIDDAPLPAHVADGDLLEGVPLVSPYVRALAYQWPVHRIGPQHRPTRPPPEPTLLLVRRDQDGRARFAALSPLAYRLLERLAGADLSGRAQLEALAAEAGVAADAAFIAQGLALLRRMHAEGTLLGTHPQA
ncbi:putative DNA-binding domain-containing protein [Xanthomonas sp. XNM01]|uniref:HvfC family RiPP maturation protein n=1 Tax=Xanthomonas sp. XNM01 TaxID=2769289 RepID=UPI001784C140|nr:putative DNA-binding domain-containing protein [Xanthomonas sp. XNM01]MBD9367594.1 putative DNA-binding domain-containing protein [Xanthomonas sp. XNM01]